MKSVVTIISLSVLGCAAKDDHLAQVTAAITLGTIPSVTRAASELNKPITVQMGWVHHNQPTIVNGYVLLSGDGRHEIWDISGLGTIQTVPYQVNSTSFRKLADFQ